MWYQSMLVAMVLLLCPSPWEISGQGRMGMSVVDAVTQQDLYNLMDTLFTGYKPEVRPTTAGEATYVYVGIYLLSIQNLDEKSQVLETSIIMDADWVDDYLSWNSSAYGNVTYFLYPQKKVWLPDIVIENSVESQRQLGYDENVVLVDESGLVNWKPSQVIKTGCDIDVTYYPFDTQKCKIIVSTWMSTKDDIDIDPESGSSGLLLDRYSVSGTWELISNELENLPTERGLTRIQFTLKLKRLRTFYILNIILPVLFLSFTASMVFFLPADAGEKIGMGITVLLAYAVYLTIIADNMPQTSLQVSYLAVYLTILLGLTALGVVLAVVVLHIHHKSDDCKISKRTEKITRKLRTLLRINRISMETQGEPEHGQAQKRTPLTKAMDKSGQHKKSLSAITPLNDNVNFSPPPSYKDDKEEITWPKVAETVDRVMFFLTSLLIAMVTIIFLPILALGGS
ncbi:neuronal acetylcholine receptor subunit alpha-3 [Elysia marginata]|uniref:Neuronal acetylcholine receptor subunit alpha-3 n=1 Tax=Elysia marginata TaxID=1093978 RepID=A0AAV4JMC8_9GAST|nr:neuronal acetylcholine receptor subunit alpha-3 [Elysia marginata]